MPETDESVAASYEFYDDPLFLSQSDQPIAKLSPTLFNGHDFLSWKQDVYMALASKNKEGFLDGSCTAPATTDKKYRQWVRCNLMVLNWILNSMEKSLRGNFKYVRSAKVLWAELNERYGLANAIKIYQIKKDMDGVSQGNASLVEYYSKLKNFWETLDNLDPLPLCTCGKMDSCTCSVVRRMFEREQNAKLIQFLMGLTSAYDHIRTQILSMDPLPTISKALGLLQKIERQKQVAELVDNIPETNAYAVSGQSILIEFWKNSRSRCTAASKFCTSCKIKGHDLSEFYRHTTCTHCKKTGHNISVCYDIHGFPGKEKGKASTKGKFNGQKGKRRANNVDVVESEDSPLEDYVPVSTAHGSAAQVDTNIASSSSSLDPAVIDGLVTSVVDQVMKRIADSHSTATAHFAGMIPESLVYSVNRSDVLPNWIIDTGASDHMTSDYSSLYNIRHLTTPIQVGLPDGSSRFVHTVGDIRLIDHITLFNVFYIPEFKQSLRCLWVV
ncbi:uncharacterized protein LOC141648610 [Silene latifolia]|uniref:uncharacterized protein LOC141648610 n=1 Tax=Silene latifolia TaxID=37657 RepID=UPI003D778E12